MAYLVNKTTNTERGREAAIVGTPHIIPDVLYPAWSGLLMENTSSTFTDSSASAHVITSGSTVNHSGGNPKIGSTSMKFDGGADAYADHTNGLTIPDSADWDLGASTDFTIEFWYNATRVSDWATIFGMGLPESSSTEAILLGHHSNTNLVFEFNNDGNYQTVVAPVIGTWYHIALTRTGSTMKIYVNGTLTLTPTNVTIGSPTGVFAIGGMSSDFTREFNGFLDEFRIVKGTGIYTGNFTPPTALTTTGGTYASGTNVNTSFTASHTKLLIHSDNGGHVGAYGTEQSDGRKYYYTDIKGSKPIKDPRVGAHFGSQRHKFRTLQMQGSTPCENKEMTVYTIDGREWARAYGSVKENVDKQHGNGIFVDGGETEHGYYEITGYFSGVNMLGTTTVGTNRGYVYSYDGAGWSSEQTTWESHANGYSPLGDRYVDRHALAAVPPEQSQNLQLGIHTISIRSHVVGDYVELGGIELIAQDTDENTLITNGTFDSATTGWTAGTSTLISTAASAGSWLQGSHKPGNSLRVTTDSGVSGYAQQDITTVVGTKYTISVLMNKGTSSTVAFNVGTTGDPDLLIGNETDFTGSGWLEQKKTFTATATTTRVRLYVRDSGGTDYSDFDSVAVYPTTEDNIQIPAQNVVSYGKKFTVAADAHHYNPFAFAGDGTTAVTINSSTTNTAKVADGWVGSTATYFDSTLDTATSLGLSVWESGGDFFRPINGGRVVKWIDSTGAIKTSVNMMPPAGTAIGPSGTTSGHNVPTGIHNWATKYQPAFYSMTIDHSQAEVAKTFHVREFGNGAANGGVGATWADMTMLSTVQDSISYVMDDGLTSFMCDEAVCLGAGINCNNNASFINITFIGSGITTHTNGMGGGGMYRHVQGPHHLCQNLPYGTHILKIVRGSAEHPTISIDDVSFGSVTDAMKYGQLFEITFHQPRMPPIPDDAVIIADYMLMADFVRQANPTGLTDMPKISKGVRRQSASRDLFCSDVAGMVISADSSAGGFYVASNSTASSNAINNKFSLPTFGTTFIAQGHSGTGKNDVHIDGVDVAHSGTSNSDHSAIVYPDSAVVLGKHDFAVHGVNSVNYSPYLSNHGFQIVTPIHTSSHYQSFESPLAYELVGGDRNMEQTNLVVTPYGDTWDEVTRDTSYIGNMSIAGTSNGAPGTVNATVNIFNDWRGSSTLSGLKFNKHFAISLDRMICLYAGQYHIVMHTQGLNAKEGRLLINGAIVTMFADSADQTAANLNYTANLMRGDYVQWSGTWSTYRQYQQFRIHKI